MPVLAAFMVPHPPLIVPEVGRGSEEQICETTEAYERVAQEVDGILWAATRASFFFEELTTGTGHSAYDNIWI